MTDSTNPENTVLHAGWRRDETAVAVPNYRTTSYHCDRPEQAATLFAPEVFGNIHTRIVNPTADVLQKRMAALEGGVAGLAIHPGTTTHSQLSAKEKLQTGGMEGYVRLAVGIAHIDDIRADLKRALTAA